MSEKQNQGNEIIILSSSDEESNSKTVGLNSGKQNSSKIKISSPIQYLKPEKSVGVSTSLAAHKNKHRRKTPCASETSNQVKSSNDSRKKHAAVDCSYLPAVFGKLFSESTKNSDDTKVFHGSKNTIRGNLIQHKSENSTVFIGKQGVVKAPRTIVQNFRKPIEKKEPVIVSKLISNISEKDETKNRERNMLKLVSNTSGPHKASQKIVAPTFLSHYKSFVASNTNAQRLKDMNIPTCKLDNLIKGGLSISKVSKGSSIASNTVCKNDCAAVSSNIFVKTNLLHSKTNTSSVSIKSATPKNCDSLNDNIKVIQPSSASMKKISDLKQSNLNKPVEPGLKTYTSDIASSNPKPFKSTAFLSVRSKSKVAVKETLAQENSFSSNVANLKVPRPEITKISKIVHDKTIHKPLTLRKTLKDGMQCKEQIASAEKNCGKKMIPSLSSDIAMIKVKNCKNQSLINHKQSLVIDLVENCGENLADSTSVVELSNKGSANNDISRSYISESQCVDTVSCIKTTLETKLHKPETLKNEKKSESKESVYSEGAKGFVMFFESQNNIKKRHLEDEKVGEIKDDFPLRKRLKLIEPQETEDILSVMKVKVHSLPLDAKKETYQEHETIKISSTTNNNECLNIETQSTRRYPIKMNEDEQLPTISDCFESLNKDLKLIAPIDIVKKIPQVVKETSEVQNGYEAIDNKESFKQLLEFCKPLMKLCAKEEEQIIKNMTGYLNSAQPSYVNSEEFCIQMTSAKNFIENDSKNVFVHLNNLVTELKAYKVKKKKVKHEIKNKCSSSQIFVTNSKPSILTEPSLDNRKVSNFSTTAQNIASSVKSLEMLNTSTVHESSINIAIPTPLPEYLSATNSVTIKNIDMHDGPAAAIPPVQEQVSVSEPSTSYEHSIATCSLKEPTTSNAKRREKCVKKLEKLLAKLHNKIQKIQAKELTLDDLDDSNSHYMYEERLKRKFLTVWSTLCKEKKRSVRVRRELDKPFAYRGSRYDVVNNAVEKFMNKKCKLPDRAFPDYSDISQLIHKVNDINDLGLTESGINGLAENVFQDVGLDLKQRRMRDEHQLLGCYLTDDHKPDDDPAANDENLNSALIANAAVGEKKIDEIMEHFVEKQHELKHKEDKVESSISEDENKENGDLPETDTLSSSDGGNSICMVSTSLLPLKAVKASHAAETKLAEFNDRNTIGIVLDINSNSGDSTEPNANAEKPKRKKAVDDNSISLEKTSSFDSTKECLDLNKTEFTGCLDKDRHESSDELPNINDLFGDM